MYQIMWENIRIYHEYDGGIEKLAPRITVRHHEASEDHRLASRDLPSAGER